ncbi:hypothetical protein F8O07_00765 [Pseudoclavibacter sp. CFCC 13796]|uniref:HdeD family acid-resistance protein n=1 Tax=Pseudoclavibacter sp. CFCC 13796 TaxID=2615179 RepID=UPI0013018081|nr:DUF308 domain-containing protein [Pseudoclavibacter sp. CFCC 13796]KAB1660556.1 hypothetical protein F8O07_00765 [Pseudoclavibacter sp. CFCC 13796]
MSNSIDADLVKKGIGSIRTALGISGVLTLLAGIAITFWPGRSAELAVAIVAIYTIIGGLVYGAISIFGKLQSGWGRVGDILLAVFMIVIGIVAFANLGSAAAAFGIVLGILVGIAWFVEGIVALAFVGDSDSKAWSIIFAVLSIIAGITLLFSPLWGAAVLWLLLGVSAIILGVAQIIRAFQFGKSLR